MDEYPDMLWLCRVCIDDGPHPPIRIVPSAWQQVDAASRRVKAIGRCDGCDAMENVTGYRLHRCTVAEALAVLGMGDRPR